MKTNKIMISKKSFEETVEDEIFNFNSDYSERVNSIEAKKTNLSLDKKNAYKPSHKRNNSRNSRNSRNSTKESPINLSIFQNSTSSLMELVESLKEKLSLYETEIRGLIDEKIEMQITINNLQMNNLKKPNRNENTNAKKHIDNEKKLFNINVDTIDENINRQKKLLEENFSILNETIGNIIIYDEIQNLNTQKDMILNEINTLKGELFALMELQSKSVEKCNVSDNFKPENCSVLQNIENFFTLNDKIYLIDTDKNIWHLKKCKKFEKFINENKFDTKEEIFNAYIEHFCNSKKIVENDKNENQDKVDIDEKIEKDMKQGDTSFILSDSN